MDKKSGGKICHRFFYVKVDRKLQPIANGSNMVITFLTEF